MALVRTQSVFESICPIRGYGDRRTVIIVVSQLDGTGPGDTVADDRRVNPCRREVPGVPLIHQINILRETISVRRTARTIASATPLVFPCPSAIDDHAVAVFGPSSAQSPLLDPVAAEGRVYRLRECSWLLGVCSFRLSGNRTSDSERHVNTIIHCPLNRRSVRFRSERPGR